RQNYINWQSAVSDAYTDYTAARADAYNTTASNIAAAVNEYQHTAADRTQSEVAALANVQHQFETQLADLVLDYRSQVADILKQATIDEVLPNYTSAETYYQPHYATLDSPRRTAMATAGAILAGGLSAAAISESIAIAGYQADFDQQAADAYFVA